MNADATVSSPAVILVVDDMPANLRLLTEGLQTRGYEVRPVLSGEAALAVALREPPDLVLLDINMPGLNGYETCTRLKQEARLAAVPVIFLSAMHETVDKVKGFEVGAVDYVTKPFRLEEVEARVRTHLELARLRRELERHSERLESTVADRTRQLAESLVQLAESQDQLAEAHARLAVLDQAKSDFLSLISHEVRTPLNGILGIAELLLLDCPEDTAAKYAPLLEQSRRRLVTLIEDALLLSEIGVNAGTGARQASRLESLLQDACRQAAPLADTLSVRFAPVPADLGDVRGLPEHLVRALRSLLETAAKFARPGSVVRITKDAAQEDVRLNIDVEGRSIPPAALPRFFQLLGIADPLTPGGDLGLAPAVAERIVTLYGGSVSIENLVPPGIRLAVQLKPPTMPGSPRPNPARVPSAEARDAG